MTLTDTQPEVRAPQLIIDGTPVVAGQSRDVINPATGSPFLTIPEASEADMERAIKAAKAASHGWAARSLGDRQAAVRRFVDVIRDRLDELSLLVTLEQGKPVSRAKGEIESGLRYCSAFAEMDIPVEVVKDDASERIEIRRTPLGVVGAITAWNYPLLLALWKLGPALVAGNPVILKPSPLTPVATLRIAELGQDVFPAGVLQTVSGGDDLGKLLTSHPDVAKISFTGSVATGRAIMASSSATLKRLTLELGGNDAGIVLDDADPAAIAADLYWGGLSNCGQVCAGLKRLYLPEALATDIEEAMAEVAAQVTVGDGRDPATVMGPLQNRMQLDKVKGLVADATSRGADAYFVGDAPVGPGFFHPVTLVRNICDDAPLVTEEQFGPVLPILTYTDVDEAVARANDSDLGLGASVWSADEDRAVAVADRLEAGSVWVNQHPMLSPDTPFGGVKQSGIGVESSRHGLLAYTDISVLRVKR